MIHSKPLFDTPEQPVSISASTALLDYSMEQVSLVDREARQDRLLLELNELASARTSLESRLTAHQNEESMSVESLATTRAIMQELFGANALSTVSLESADAGEMTVEGLMDSIRNINRSMQKKYGALLESIRWVTTNLFGGLAKGESYLNSVSKDLERMKFQAKGDEYVSPNMATGYLHFNGKGDAKSVLEGLRQNTRAFESMIAIAPLATRELSKLARSAATRIMDEMSRSKNEDSIKAVVERIYTETVEEAEKISASYRKDITDLSGTALSGGREIRYRPARRFGDSPQVALDITPTRGKTPASLELPTKNELEQLIEETLAGIQSLRSAKSSVEQTHALFVETLSGETADADLGKPDKKTKDFWLDDFSTIFFSFYFTVLFGLVSVVSPIAATLSIAFGISFIVNIVKSIFSVIKGDYKEGKFGTRKERINEIIDTQLKSPLASGASDLVEIVDSYAKFQNSAVRASIQYIHSSFEFYGNDDGDPLK